MQENDLTHCLKYFSGRTKANPEFVTLTDKEVDKIGNLSIRLHRI